MTTNPPKHQPYLFRLVGAARRHDPHPILLREVMGGALVFRGSRLTLAAVAGRLRAGERWVEITEDYPYLLPDDVELLRAYRPAPLG